MEHEEEEYFRQLMSVIAFHEKAGRSQVDWGFVKHCFFSCRVATVAMLPSALSRSESFRSVHVGRSRFSRCCHLINDLGFILRMKVGLAINAVTGTRLWLLSFLFLERFCLVFRF
jgi:hypothetical protein